MYTHNKMIGAKKDFCFEEFTAISFINLNKQETELVRKWRNHQNIRKWMCSQEIISPKRHFDFIRGLRDDKKIFYWLLKHKDKEYLGVIYLSRLDKVNKNAYLGIYKDPFAKVAGVGSSLIKYLINIAFRIMELHTLKLEVLEDNEKAIKFYRKCGFSQEGTLKEFIFRDGKWLNAVVMGIINQKKL